MAGERATREKSVAGHKAMTNKPRRHHWALLPFLGGVLIGLAISTVAVVRPTITNVYISIGERILVILAVAQTKLAAM